MTIDFIRDGKMQSNAQHIQNNQLYCILGCKLARLIVNCLAVYNLNKFENVFKLKLFILQANL